jgi:Uma2 family endonuclease
MGMPAELRRWTAAEVRELQDEERAWPRYELIAGELLVTPAPLVVHQRAVGALFRALGDYLDVEPIGEVTLSPADLELDPGNITQPDVFVVPGAPGRVWRSWPEVKALLLAVEVLSPGNAHIDRARKRAYYQRVGVQECWLVDLDARLLERWRPRDERPEIVRGELAWRPDGAARQLTIDLPAFFARVMRDDVERADGNG